LLFRQAFEVLFTTVIMRLCSHIYSGTCSQGGVKVPTGGIPVSNRKARERFLEHRKVCRFGEKPKPTVTVRMKENRDAFRIPAP
jgi:hypothetical protein